jgi:tRNA pseudouridine55 synthase
LGELAGVLVIDKPAKVTSHDVVAMVRKKLKTRKVGHAGTLDPDVTGVLVLCVGAATRLLEYVTAEVKVYEGKVAFGTGTNTDDASGEVIARGDPSGLTEAMVINQADAMVGESMQKVPQFSAVHVGGQRAYDLARRGVEMDLPIRPVVISEFKVWGYAGGNPVTAEFRVRCSKGTYIRALCRDWGEALGVPAHLSVLRRIQSGDYVISEAVSLDVFLSATDAADYLMPMETAIRSLEKVYVSEQMADALAVGKQIIVHMDAVQGPVAVLSEDANGLVAIASVSQQISGGLALQPKKVFWKREL